MNIIDIIENKKNGYELTEEEIKYFIENYTNGEIPDYQAAALIMAICINGMTQDEILSLTMAMAKSGDVLDLSDISNHIVDKHSTGGVGDKITLIVMPIIAALGIPVAKMSGRGLGHTGGTLDKLESIPGFDIYETKEEFKKQVKEIGMAIIGQNENLDPADKKLYALRDVTATVDSIPLIASSIMSKKLASGADCILLDVKYGSGAFMKTKEEAKKLGDLMSEIGKRLNKDVRYEVTDMNEPLGYAVGNNLEIKEVIKTLHNEGPKDLTELCLNSGAIMLIQSKIYEDYDKAYEALLNNLKNGKAFNKFVEFVKYQKGDISYILDPSKFSVSKYQIPIYAEKNGKIARIDALAIGKGSMHLGGGREVITDTIDMSAGIVLNKKVGDAVKKGELLCTLYTNKEKVEDIIKEVKEAFIY